MKVSEVIALASNGHDRYQLVGAHTGKKLANSWYTPKAVKKYLDCECPGIFSGFRTYKDYFDKNINQVSPIINIWVSGK